jgi:hypothetical protein
MRDMTQHENQNVSQIKELCGDKRIGNPLLKRGAMKSDILDLLATPSTRGDKIEIEGISLSATLAHNLDKIANRAGLSHQEREIYELMLANASPEQWSALARHQRISRAALKMRPSRLQKKLRDAVT